MYSAIVVHIAASPFAWMRAYPLAGGFIQVTQQLLVCVMNLLPVYVILEGLLCTGKGAASYGLNVKNDGFG